MIPTSKQQQHWSIIAHTSECRPFIYPSIQSAKGYHDRHIQSTKHIHTTTQKILFSTNTKRLTTLSQCMTNPSIHSLKFVTYTFLRPFLPLLTFWFFPCYTNKTQIKTNSLSDSHMLSFHNVIIDTVKSGFLTSYLRRPS